MRAPRLALVLVAAVALAASTPAAAQAPPLDSARLDGTFQLAGRVTVAVNVRGERAGQTVTRFWTFTSLCPSGQCGTVRLVRNRAHGTDTVILVRRGPGFYRGTGSFFAPLRCGKHTNRRGQKVPFTIRVWITQADLVNGQDTAVRVRATYTNRKRINFTRCVAVLGHDAARYHGHIVLPPPPPPAGSSAAPRGARSPASPTAPEGTTLPGSPPATSAATSPQPAGS